jgi:hypothetical protein
MDMLLWCVLALLVLVAVWGWGEFYEWFVELAYHHTEPGSLRAHPYPNQDG